jgi:hypothetical protein
MAEHTTVDGSTQNIASCGRPQGRVLGGRGWELVWVGVVV